MYACYEYDVCTDDVYNDKRKPITNIQFKKKLENLKNKVNSPDKISNEVSEIIDICRNIRAVFIYKNLNLTLSVSTTSFINIVYSTHNKKISIIFLLIRFMEERREIKRKKGIG